MIYSIQKVFILQEGDYSEKEEEVGVYLDLTKLKND